MLARTYCGEQETRNVHGPILEATSPNDKRPGFEKSGRCVEKDRGPKESTRTTFFTGEGALRKHPVTDEDW